MLNTLLLLTNSLMATIVPAGLIEFVKTGPFAHDSVISFWCVWIVFFEWIMSMTVVSLPRNRAERRHDAKVPAPPAEEEYHALT